MLQAIFGFPLLPLCATCALAQSLHQNYSKFISQVYNNIIKVRHSFGVTRNSDWHKKRQLRKIEIVTSKKEKNVGKLRSIDIQINLNLANLLLNLSRNFQRDSLKRSMEFAIVQNQFNIYI